ncbi:hypothetical protein FS837_005291 [Tulasnella sp. UAMH 9824]|nr:hypothetical protein FS837_005291 [Tulasnella sp. UAMH 9824]
MRSTLIFLTSAFLCASGQQIYDIFTTTWDRSSLFTYTNLSPNPINFQSGIAAGDAVIAISPDTVYQTMDGFGATLTDSSAKLMSDLKNGAWQSYWDLLGYLFDITDGKSSAGLSALRIPVGASDFSESVYSWDDTSGDTSLSQFNINSVPSYVWTVLADIVYVQPSIKLYIVPWSPPGWMKESGSMKGGSLQTQYFNTYANYLLKAVQAFKSKGYNVYAVSLQNEPLNSNPTYPTAYLASADEATIGQTLRGLLNSNGLSSVKLIGYEHNWVNTDYPMDVIGKAGSSFAGVSFHCYEGAVGAQTTFHNAFPNAEVHFTECSGMLGTDWWGDIKWNMDNLVIGAPQNWARTVMNWALALDPSGNPKLPGTDSCGGPGCRGMVTISGTTWSVNQEFYTLAQGSRAILPKDAGGPWGQRIGLSISGNLSWALRVNAFVTKRTNSSDWLRYSIVVLNWNDSSGGSWNPQPVKATINFKGVTAAYTFPVGVTTLWWYGAP